MQVIDFSGRCEYIHVRSTATSMLQRPEKSMICILIELIC